MLRNRVTTVICVCGIVWISLAEGCDSKTAIIVEPASRKIIIPGAGVRGCFIGRKQRDLPGDWQPAEYDIEELILPDKGVIVRARAGSVFRVAFIYDAELWSEIVQAAFIGKTREGASATSTVADVIRSYGQPRMIAATESSQGHSVCLVYRDLGIEFDFLRGKLNTINIASPDEKINPVLDQDIGDTRQYREMPSENSGD